MPTYWTIEVAGVEKQFKDWKISFHDFQVSRTNKGKATAVLRTLEGFDPAATQWTTKQHAIIYRDRVSTDGTANSFTSGSIYFQGYFDDPSQVNSGGDQSIQYRLFNVWWLFERNYFKQYRFNFTGFDLTHTRVISATVAAGGTGYKVGDELTVVGGTGSAATVLVGAVDGGGLGPGVPTLVLVSNNGGSYTVNPTLSGVATTGGTGSGCTLNLNMGPVPNTTKVVMSELFLGEGLNDAGFVYHWSNGAQIGEILDWMNETYNPTKRGAVSGRSDAQDVITKGVVEPHTMAPITRLNSLFCSEAINNVLRWDPDAIIIEDPTTTIPTISVRKLGRWDTSTIPPTFLDYNNLPEVVHTITAEQEAEVTMQDTAASVVPGVIIYYDSVNQVDNQTFAQRVTDKYPLTITDWDPEVVSQTIKLGGSKVVHVQATVVTALIAQAQSVTASDRKQWWKDHDKTINTTHDPRVNDSSIVAGVATIKDDSGTDIDTSVYKYELLSTMPGFVGGSVVRARVSAQVDLDRFADAAHHIKQVSHVGRISTQTIKLTNTPGAFYKRVSEFESAEVPPQGVAESVYRSMTADGWQGSITFQDKVLRSDIGIGNRLKLIGPNNTFQNILIQEITTKPAIGQTTVAFGPGPGVDINLWIELARATRLRTTYDMPSGRGDGGINNNSGQVDTGADGPGDNVAHGTGGSQFHGVTYDL